MNKLLTALFILTSLTCGATTIPEAEAWVNRELTANETNTIHYLERVKIRGNKRVLCFYGWAQIDNTQTNTIVPQSVADQVYGQGVVSNVPIPQLSLKCQIVPKAPATSVYTMAANYNLAPNPPSRTRYTDADDGVQWLGLSSLYTTNFYNTAERSVLMESPEE